MPDALRFPSLAAARAELLRLRESGATATERGMSLPQALLHCAQSIDYSLDGFPQMKPTLLRRTVGRLVSWRFLSAGKMRHNLGAPVPGAPALPATGDVEAAWERLLLAIDRFEQQAGPPREHFLFGRLSKDEFGRLHAMHLADHLSALAIRR